jgi:hypothetical protein
VIDPKAMNSPARSTSPTTATCSRVWWQRMSHESCL